MPKDGDKLQRYISKKWLKDFLKLIITVIIPYNLVLILLWKLSVLTGPVFHPLSIWGTFAIAFAWSIIRRRRTASKG